MTGTAHTRFEFATAARIVFGAGALGEIGGLVREFGRHALLVTGRTPERAEGLVRRLSDARIAVTRWPVEGEPDLAGVRRGVSVARGAEVDFVIGFGGGSAVDAAKAIAALLANDGDVLDYVEIIGRGRALVRPSLPCVAVPTTAGTGSEVARNAVLTSREDRVKVSLRSPFLFPRLAIVDPELTIDLPPAVTASTGIDALTQLIEPYLSRRSTPMTDAWCVDGMRRAAGALRTAFRDGHNRDARHAMALSSLLSGMALTNAGLGAVHGFAGPIGGMFEAPHGAVCAALLPHVMAGNLDALRTRAPESEALRRFTAIAQLLTDNSSAAADQGIAWLHALVHDLGIPPLRAYGVRLGHVDEIVGHAVRSSSMKANPIDLDADELGRILTGAI